MENTMRIREKVYEFPDEYMEQANLNGISKSQIRKRLEYNWTVKEACYVPQGMKLDDYRFMVQEREREERERNAYGNLLEEKQQSERPWLYDGTPQKHERSKWCEYLMKTSIYPKAVH
ncbi:SA1788 family PVL leukocidin-associated protein [Staphylococcus gallinarum]|uniref:SA1788 family PVL leukocidin-associated protein n=1 Tax=Staphylococcus gallinarum TaxID=1293 RepID=UPI000D1E3733|nr:SA1788 family PVL leukocidin-associated protein [Staphylococcus gallinarum]MCD8830276.1 hypothetical protein [Staphylococcus gallinarum]MEB6054409.1 hypothetical protein [Staphylococcus gallinarum]MEB6277517.1 hypothetical protein [Staphylococcus gallinarum]MEB7040136.1 hypothetical protein [Staphylococcus gallinarum]PTK92536.1 hypothetical protein BUZ13_08020 [Staphylococcus gallinarum]